MKSVARHLNELFEFAHKNIERLQDNDQSLLLELNKQLVSRRLGRRLIVLENSRKHLHPSMNFERNGNVYSWGRLGGFALLPDEEEDCVKPVVILSDVREARGHTQLVPLMGSEVPYDVDKHTEDSGALSDAMDVIVSPSFNFPDLAEACRQVVGTNLDLALFAAALNNFALPRDLATRVLIDRTTIFYQVDDRVRHIGSVLCHSGGKMIVPHASEDYEYFNFEPRDMFELVVPSDANTVPDLVVTSRLPMHPLAPYRGIRIDSSIVGHE